MSKFEKGPSRDRITGTDVCYWFVANVELMPVVRFSRLDEIVAPAGDQCLAKQNQLDTGG